MNTLLVSYEQNRQLLARGHHLEGEPWLNAVSRIVNDHVRPSRELFTVTELVERVSPTRYRVPIGTRVGTATDLASFPVVIVDRMP